MWHFNLYTPKTLKRGEWPIEAAVNSEFEAIFDKFLKNGVKDQAIFDIVGVLKMPFQSLNYG